MIPQRLPTLVLAALYADINQDKWFAQKPLAYRPPREVGLLVERKIHFARLSSCRQPRGRHACILTHRFQSVQAHHREKLKWVLVRQFLHFIGSSSSWEPSKVSTA